MQNLSEAQNTSLGASAAFVEAIVLQPTIYWKNARMQGLPFTANPKVLYRGMGAALCNEMGQMGIQFGLTGFLKKMFAGDKCRDLSGSEEIQAAFIGGAICALFAAPVELTMIQQQRFGGSILKVPVEVVRQYGLQNGLMRGFWGTAVRDGLYVGALLGVTPVAQDYLVQNQGWSMSAAGFWASLGAGATAGVLTCPMDCIKTCMAGDLQQKEFSTLTKTTQVLWNQGGIRRIFGGVSWRTINIIGTIYLANEARVRLAPVMFPDVEFRHATA